MSFTNLVLLPVKKDGLYIYMSQTNQGDLDLIQIQIELRKVKHVSIWRESLYYKNFCF